MMHTPRWPGQHPGPMVVGRHNALKRCGVRERQLAQQLKHRGTMMSSLLKVPHSSGAAVASCMRQ